MIMSIRDKLSELLSDVDVCLYLFDPDDYGIHYECPAHYVVAMYGYDVELVHKHGGENKGLDYYTVVKFTDCNGSSQLVKFVGQYHSYVGAEYNRYDFVEPKTKTVVVYE